MCSSDLTFHSFGTEIINQHREYFFHGADAQPADELTQHQIVTGILEGLDWRNPLSAKNNGEFVYTRELIRVISEFKQSGLTPAELRAITADNQRAIADITAGIQIFRFGNSPAIALKRFSKLILLCA